MSCRLRNNVYLWTTTYIQNVKAFTTVMQSDGNSFGGDVVLDSVNVASKDKDSILDQIYANRFFFISIMKITVFKKD